MNKVIFHNLSIPYSHPLIGMYDFDKNGIFYATPGDIVVTRSKISKAYLGFLESCGYDFDNVRFVSSDEELENTHNSPFENNNFLKQIKKSINDPKEYVFDSFIFSKLESELVNQLGVVSLEKANQFQDFSTKSFFRATAKQLKIPIPRGFEAVTTTYDAFIKICYLFLNGFKNVVSKYNNGSAGIGTRLYRSRNFLSELNILESYFKKDNNTLLGFADLEARSFVIEGWYDNAAYSPSVQFYVDAAGVASVVSIHNQVFYDNKITYRGCCSKQTIPKQVAEKLVEEGTKFVNYLSEQGYRGHLGFNSIVLTNGDLLWVELNPRRVMSSYVYQMSRMIYQSDAASIYYKSLQVSKEKWVGKEIDEILVELSNVLFSKDRQNGVIPFNYGLLQTEGTLSVAVFSTTEDDTDKMIKYVESL
ncbi:hypothetical protein A3I99_01255 [Candidatus Kaiserbacteria bacterium RIFCSPLOWO2_02_FULL_45_11b]|uniref:ATP-grasp domain-containing protein n=1 Tax=Candidatus Kaiserbacteria bacterium RIFCSPLOWO2_12_FULL_45_26 TaxID=1798525 RepID=A0A1F6FFP3_9BACT|nr:MAG: hypothetical protein A2Z56_02150 [Candidatus Kaiserbacteria bacterium RIFCSPHIGHO2_12_45_16]OGG70414.1 MAG: hypothetical protein A2929_01335 [Candidatus Kaiserbacteria bacterium RIFCSPLOWO2_01_FULL_45_25]OGG80945.1 MAG: hypothetical protein A3I99_01255 [Candidatus Kaiserbacteria bacterium RIFCSPLOWO2_02_FULL_45_11b]OGG84686.1 MAG: hypothetical protein A3G90_01200 [Candidatus Kaiserbacteria bacterium RIFCSPLOWO2_12_FULL_45_26]